MPPKRLDTGPCAVYILASSRQSPDLHSHLHVILLRLTLLCRGWQWRKCCWGACYDRAWCGGHHFQQPGTRSGLARSSQVSGWGQDIISLDEVSPLHLFRAYKPFRIVSSYQGIWAACPCLLCYLQRLLQGLGTERCQMSCQRGCKILCSLPLIWIDGAGACISRRTCEFASLYRVQDCQENLFMQWASSARKSSGKIGRRRGSIGWRTWYGVSERDSTRPGSRCRVMCFIPTARHRRAIQTANVRVVLTTPPSPVGTSEGTTPCPKRTVWRLCKDWNGSWIAYETALPAAPIVQQKSRYTSNG